MTIKNRIIGFICTLACAFALVQPVSLATDSKQAGFSAEENAIAEIAENYLLESAYAIYYIVVPKTFRSGSTATRVWAKLHNAYFAGQTLSLASYASVTVQTLVTNIYAPNATTPTASYSTNSASSWSSNFTFNQAGDWKIVVVAGANGIPLATHTSIVRIV